MRELVMFAILFAAMFLLVPIVVTLAVTFVIWKTWWARAAHVTASLAITAALTFGIYQLIHVVPPGACVHRHDGQACVKGLD